MINNQNTYLMNNDEFNKIPDQLKKQIPIQKVGKCSDTYSSLEIKELNNPDIAYKSIKHRLLDVNNWAHYATLTNADFILLDNNGNNLEGLVTEDCFMKVRFSRLQKIISARHDYVRVHRIFNVPDFFDDALIMQLIPAHNPTKPGTEIGHFFTAEASNTFVLYRDNDKIHLSVHGRNEVPNFKVSKTTKKLRNMVFAALGIVAVSKVQWKSLAHGLLNYNEKIL